MGLKCAVLLTGLLTAGAVAQEAKPVITAAPRPQATAPAASPADTKPNDISSDTYIIGQGDVLALNVWKEPGVSNSGVPVRPDGQVSLPLLGDVPAAGLTPMALGNDVTQRLKKFVTDPQVTVTVVSVHSKEIFLIGEIGRTGAIALTPGMTPLQAIAAAGGLGPFAKKKLYILRKTGAKQQKIFFDYKKAIKTGDQQGVSLVSGDTIVVP